MSLLMKNRDAFKQPPIDGADVASEHELFLVQHTGRPTFLVDWPAKIKPFYMRTNDDDYILVNFYTSKKKKTKKHKNLTMFVLFRFRASTCSFPMLVSFAVGVYVKTDTIS